MILDRLQATPEGWLPIGERSSPTDINREFPGVSKVVFKNALGGLYKKGESRKESQQRYLFLTGLYFVGAYHLTIRFMLGVVSGCRTCEAWS